MKHLPYIDNSERSSSQDKRFISSVTRFDKEGEITTTECVDGVRGFGFSGHDLQLTYHLMNGERVNVSITGEILDALNNLREDVTDEA